MKHFLGSRFQVVWLLLFCLMTGCSNDAPVGDREEVYPVTGRITLKGEPVEGAIVIFHSTVKELSAQGMTDADGRYHLMTFDDNDGAVLGEHIVTVRKTEYTKVPTKFHTEEEPSYISIPKELLAKEAATRETSKLGATVQKGGSADLDFDF